MSARELVFDPIAHRYSVRGEQLPSVTRVLKLLSSYSDAIPAAVLANKSAIGQAAHKCVELLNERRLNPATVHPVVSGYLDGYKRFRDERGFEPVLNETRVWHPLMRFAGTLDLLGTISGDPALVDLKCTLELMPTVGPQTAAYQQAATETPDLDDEIRELARVARRYCLQLREDGTYALTPCDDPNDWRVFLAALNLYYFKVKNAKHYSHEL